MSPGAATPSPPPHRGALPTWRRVTLGGEAGRAGSQFEHLPRVPEGAAGERGGPLGVVPGVLAGSLSLWLWGPVLFLTSWRAGRCGESVLHLQRVERRLVLEGPPPAQRRQRAPCSPSPGDRAVGTAHRQALWGDLEGQEGARRQQRRGCGPSAHWAWGRLEGRHLLRPHSAVGKQAGLLGPRGPAPPSALTGHARLPHSSPPPSEDPHREDCHSEPRPLW